MAIEEKARMQQRRAPTAQWVSEDEVLKDGEIGLERATGDADRMKIGDGILQWTALPYTSNDDFTLATGDSVLTKSAIEVGIVQALYADTRIPTQSENDALVGTSGSPSASNKFVTNQDSRLTSTMLSGLILPFAASAVPFGYLACEGQAVSRATYSDLFTAIGVVWGVGNGTTTFNVPDLQGRALIGSGSGSGLSARVIGSTGGEEDHTLTEAELAAHRHTLGHTVDTGSDGTASQYQPSYLRNNSSGVPIAPFPVITTPETDNLINGEDTPHNTMQPFAVVRYMIKT